MTQQLHDTPNPGPGDSDGPDVASREARAEAASRLANVIRVAKHTYGSMITTIRPDLPGSAGPLLMAIGRLAPCRSAKLAELHFLDASTISRQVDLLVRKSLVRRTPDPEDRRASLLETTAEGSAVLDDMIVLRDEISQRIFGEFSGSELSTLNFLHERLFDAMSADLARDGTEFSACSPITDAESRAKADR